MTVLKAPIKVTYEGKTVSMQYRAILEQTPDDLPTITTQQQIKNDWHKSKPDLFRVVVAGVNALDDQS